MPRQTDADTLYTRGPYRLCRRGERNLEIIWYDEQRKRNRSLSAGSRDVQESIKALDRHYLKTHTAENICPTCGQSRQGAESQYLTAAIADYLISAEGKSSIEAIRARLHHILAYIETLPSAAIRCTDVTEAWAEQFRIWALAQPILFPKGGSRPRAPGTVENSLIQLAAVINHAHQRHATPFPAAFRPIPTTEVNRTPQYRAPLETIAAMFAYALAPGKITGQPMQPRADLLSFLRLAVATWARPDAILDLSVAPERRQWFADARVIALNPFGRRQTRKRRATIPAARQIIPLLAASTGPVIKAESITSAWDSMAKAISLPGEGQAGTKLLRRSVAHHARKLIGEAQWRQGEIWLGHQKSSISDIYALPDPANLGLALAATEQLIDQIEALCPGAFTALSPQPKPALHCIEGGKNG